MYLQLFAMSKSIVNVLITDILRKYYVLGFPIYTHKMILPHIVWHVVASVLGHVLADYNWIDAHAQNLIMTNFLILRLFT